MRFSSRLGEAGGSLNLGEVRQLKGEHAAALADFQLAAAIWRNLGHRSQEALAVDATGTSLQALGRFHEAIGFHARAAATHREMHDSWHEAIAMDHLAAAQRQLDLMAEATASLQAAQALLQEFDDPPARTLKASIAATLEQAAA